MAIKKTGKKSDLKTTDFLKIKEGRTGAISKIVAPHDFQVGVGAESYRSSLTSTGIIVAQQGFSGSLTKLEDGNPYLKAGTNVTLATGSDGSVTITAGGFSANPLSLGSGLEFDSGTTYDGSTSRTISPKLVNGGGLATPSAAGLRFSFDNVYTDTIETEDIILFGETDNATAYFPKKCTVADLLALGTAATLTNAITLGNGVEDSAGGASSYNNTAAITLAITAESSKGIGVTSSGIKIDPSTLSSATVATGDKVLIGDVNDSDNIKYVTAQSIADLASVGALTNALTVGNGLQLNSGTTFDGSSAKTLTAQAANSTISIASAGISVLKVPNHLTSSRGISSFSYDGSSAGVAIKVEIDPNGGLGFDENDAVSLEISNLPTADLTLMDYIPFYDYSGGTTAVSKTTANQLRTLISGDITSVTAGAGLTGGGSTGDLTLAINNNVVATISGSTFTGGVKFDTGLTGSLTKLPDGTDFLRAGTNVSLNVGSKGEVTISAVAGGGGIADGNAEYLVLKATGSLSAERVLTMGTGLTSSDSGAGNNYTLAVRDSIFAALTGSQFSGNVGVTGSIGSTSLITSPAFSGSLTRLQGGASYLVAGSGIAIVSASNGSITISNDGTVGDITSVVAGTGLSGGGTSGAVTLNIRDSIVATLTGSQFSGNIGVTGSIGSTSLITSPALSGSLTRLQDGSSYILAGTNTTVVSASNGSITVASTNTTYTAGDGLDLSGTIFSTDLKTSGGLKIDSTELAIDDNVVATVSGSTFTGAVNFNSGLSGSLTQLTDGTSYLVAGNNIQIATGSSGVITITGTSTGDITSVVAGTGLIGGGVSGDVTLNIDNSVVATLTGSQFSGNIGVTGSIGSTSVITSPALSGSLTQLNTGVSYLVAGANITIASASNGQVTVTSTATSNDSYFDSPAAGSLVTTGSTSFSGGKGSSYETSNVGTDTFFFVSGSLSSKDTSTRGAAVFGGDIVVSGTMYGTGTIGPAEDGTYTDGLFTSFVSTTPIGTAVDRFNEVLKALSPAPAPDLDNINSSETGVASFLSFGASSAVGGYTNVAASAGLGSAVDVNGTYQITTASNNIRVATFAGSTQMTGTLNSDVPASNYSNGVTNYFTSSFGDANTGVLRLMVNGSNVKEIDLTVGSIGAGTPSAGTGTYTNSNGSGFIQFSQTGSAVFSDSNTLTFFQHRTGKYVVSNTDQRNGWNYARVLHVVTGSTKQTNYIEWVNDSDANALAASEETIDNFDLGKGIHLSGVQYYISGTADYKVNVSNVYRNVYSGSSTFNTTNCSISSQTIPVLNTGAGENNLTTLKVTGSATITATTLLNQAIVSSINVEHPLKSNLSSGGSVTSGGILLYSASNNSTDLVETFKRENYRITSASYDSQASVTAVAATWNSVLHLSSSVSQSDGLILYNQKLYTPTNSLLSGDFRSSADGGSITYAPASNPNYSGLNTGIKTFYRYFKNTGAAKRDFSVDIDGSGTIVQQGTTNNASKISVLFKLPNTSTYQTGWLDLSQAFVAGSYSNSNGCLVGSLDSSLDAVNIATFGTQSIGTNEYIVAKIEASASWTGNIDDITISFGAGTGVAPSEAPALDDIDCDDSGTGTKLSFGSSQSISGYTDVAASAGIGSAVNVNGNYIQTSSGNNLRRAVFNGSTVVNGTLNEDVSSNGSSYVANAFRSGSFGSLKLEVNGSVIHTTNLVNFSSGNSLNGNSSGFKSLLSATPGEYSGNNVPDYTLIYRTGEFQVGTSDQRNGWNYARVIHSVNGVDTTTNYVEWVNDPNSDALSTSGELFDNFGSNSTLFYQSGVKYFISCTSSFAYSAANVYKNVYSRDSAAVTSPTRSNMSVTQIAINGDGVTNSTNSNYFSSLASLDTSTTDCEQKNINVTGSISFGQNNSTVGPYGTGYYTASISGQVLHPLKSSITTSTFSKSGFLVFSASQTSTKYTVENFDDENYRLTSASFGTQSSVNSATWDPTISMNDAAQSAYYDGLLIYNGNLVSPKTGSTGTGDFRSVRDGGTLQSPDSNVNYSSLTLPTRNYTRYFDNNTTNDVPQINVMMTGSATLVAQSGPNSGSLGANNNFHCSIKIPGKTGWLDLAKPSGGAGTTSDNDGGLSGDLTSAIGDAGTLNICTFNAQTQNGTTSGAEYVVIRIIAHENWIGNLSNITVGY